MNGRWARIGRRLVGRHPGLALVGVPCVILAIVAELVWFPGSSPSGAGSNPGAVAPIPQNRPAPEFDLPLLSGSGRLSLQAMRGHVLVVNFWASWCTACQREAPALRQLAQHYRGTEVRFLGVDHGDRQSPARAYLRRNGVDYPSVVDESGAVLSKYGANGLPITYVIGRDGRIRYEAIGLVDPAALQHAVDRVRAG